MSQKFRLLSFAAIAQQDEEHVFHTPFGTRTHRRREGEALHPGREPLDVLEGQRRLLGSRFFSAQYLQEPVPLEGNLAKRAWFGTYGPADILNPDRVIQSWDTASKVNQLNDYSVGTTWALKGSAIYLLDVFRDKLELPALKRRIIELSDRYRAELVLIEDKGSGTSLLQELPASHFYKTKPFLPKGDKILRFHGVTPMIEAGHVRLPESALWRDSYLHELCSFPSVKHDDQVDSTSQALTWIREFGTMPGLIEYYRQEVEAKLAFAVNRTVHLRAPHGVSHVGMLDGHYLPVDVDGTIWVTGENAASLRRAGFVQLA